MNDTERAVAEWTETVREATAEWRSKVAAANLRMQAVVMGVEAPVEPPVPEAQPPEPAPETEVDLVDAMHAQGSDLTPDAVDRWISRSGGMKTTGLDD